MSPKYFGFELTTMLKIPGLLLYLVTSVFLDFKVPPPWSALVHLLRKCTAESQVSWVLVLFLLPASKVPLSKPLSSFSALLLICSKRGKN